MPNPLKTEEAASGRTPGMRVAEEIKAAILKGDIAPGQRLIELELARELGASRAHVREGLQQLRAEGLVVIEAHRGAMVKILSREDVYLAGRVREALEGLAARQLAERIPTPEQRAVLTDIRQRLTRSVEAGDLDLYQQANEALHRFIVRESGNPYLQEFLDRLRLVVRQTQHMQVHRTQTLFEGNVEHLAIIDAILLNHPDVAENMMRMHIRKGTQMIDNWLSGNGDV